MTKKQFVATSFVGAVPAAGLITVLALAAGGGSSFTLPMWGLWGTTLVAAIVTLATPVAVFLLIPADAATAVPSKRSSKQEDTSSDTEDDADVEEFDDDDEEPPEDNYNAAETEVAQAGELDDFDDDGDFQDDEDFDDAFDDFDDDEDFV